VLAARRFDFERDDGAAIDLGSSGPEPDRRQGGLPRRAGVPERGRRATHRARRSQNERSEAERPDARQESLSYRARHRDCRGGTALREVRGARGVGESE